MGYCHSPCFYVSDSPKLNAYLEVSMENVPVACLLLITVIAIYFPIAHIRLSNKMLKMLERIEENTGKK